MANMVKLAAAIDRYAQLRKVAADLVVEVLALEDKLKKAQAKHDKAQADIKAHRAKFDALVEEA